MITLKQVVVAMDFGEAAEVALRYGRELARTFGATLHVVHVVDDIQVRVTNASAIPDHIAGLSRLQSELEANAHKQLDELVSDEDRRNLHAQTVVLRGTAVADAILAYAKSVSADIVVSGTHGRGALKQFFMGSVAERLVRFAPCPVLTVRHPEHEFVLPDALQVVPRH